MNKKYKIIALVLVLIAICFAVVYVKEANTNSPNSKLEKVKVQAGWLLNGEFANVCAALVNGYYLDQGLDVELVPGGPSGASFVIATNAIALDDSLTIGIDGDLVPLLRGKDPKNSNAQIKVKVFAAFWNDNPYGFMVRTDSGLNSIRDFAKRKPDGSKYKIGVSADSVIQYAIAKYLEVQVSDLDLVTVGFDTSPFLAKQVDVLAGYWTTQAYELEKAGIEYKFLPVGELPGFNQPSMIAMATNKTLTEKKDVLIKWLQATIQGIGFVKNNPDVAAKDILDPRCGGASFNQEQEAWLIKKSLPLFDSQKPGWIYDQQIIGFANAYNTLGQISRIPSISELVDYSILQAIYK